MAVEPAGRVIDAPGVGGLIGVSKDKDDHTVCPSTRVKCIPSS